MSEQRKMSAGRIVGGIIALVAGVLLLFGAIIAFMEYTMDFTDPMFLSNLIIAIIIIVGGILGIVQKTAGGILALIGGAISLIGALLALYASFYYLWPLSVFFFIYPSWLTYYFPIEAIIAIVGGIIILVSKGK